MIPDNAAGNIVKDFYKKKTVLLVRKPQKVAVALPPDERNTWLVDLNRDGKQDLLVHQTPTGHEPTKPNRVTMLVAR